MYIAGEDIHHPLQPRKLSDKTEELFFAVNYSHISRFPRLALNNPEKQTETACAYNDRKPHCSSSQTQTAPPICFTLSYDLTPYILLIFTLSAILVSAIKCLILGCCIKGREKDYLVRPDFSG